MTPSDLRATLSRLALSQAALARLLRVDTVTVNRWASGRQPIPYAVELLLELAGERLAERT